MIPQIQAEKKTELERRAVYLFLVFITKLNVNEKYMTEKWAENKGKWKKRKKRKKNEIGKIG